MYNQYKSFEYEKPEMTIDKETGDVHIFDPMEEKKKNKGGIIRSFDEINEEKEKLLEELDMEDMTTPKSDNWKHEEMVKKAEKLRRHYMQNFNVDPSQFYCFSRDFLRIDIGLIIQRAPIFLHMREKDINFIDKRSNIMNEYHCDTKQFIEEFREVSKLNEDILNKNPYHSNMNTDNHPTDFKGENGEEHSYAAASKQWYRVDPTCQDMKSLHYAGEDRTYLIVKNKFTGEWEFPVSKMMMSDTFFKTKLNLFNQLSDNKWRITFFGSAPQVHTLREFTKVEEEDRLNESLKGVRTYFFGAHHRRGLPIMTIKPGEDIEGLDYDDWLWVPKRQLNEYFARDYYDIFAKSLFTR
mmetsp:Transcript_8749/g.13531  ORF Transcript_8749/g.13531 Transcript_8749/m.13531 type:complete len:353 (-) Transcript_8749:8-1066(-)